MPLEKWKPQNVDNKPLDAYARTGATQVGWVVEVYPHAQDKPQFTAPDPNSPVLLGSEKDVNFLAQVLQEAFGITAKTGPGPKSIFFGRSMDRPDETLSIVFVGHSVSRAITLGSWIIVTSIGSAGLSKEKTALPKFIGIVQDISVAYNTDQVTGNVIVATTVIVKEWSSVFTVPIRFDAVSVISSTISSASAAGSLAVFGKIASAYQKFINLAGAGKGGVYNAYQLAAMIIAFMVGASQMDSSAKYVGSGGKIKVTGQAETSASAIRLPKVPTALLKRIKAEIGGKVATEEGAFAEGFFRVILGRIGSKQTLKDGVFASKSEMEAYIDSYSVPSGQPTTLSLHALLQAGQSAWSLLTSFTDPVRNEVFTDILYYKVGVAIVPQPVLYVREKPYMDDTVAALVALTPKGVASPLNTAQITSEWAKYKNLPSISVRSEYIVSLNLGMSTINAPNYIRVNYSVPQGGVGSQTNQSLAAVQGFNVLPDERKRFGGKELFAQTSYLVPPAGSIQAWFSKLAIALTAIHAYDYKMAHGTIVMKDYNQPIFIGSTIKFRVGPNVLMGHVDKIVYSASVTDTAIATTSLTVTISRVMLYSEEANALAFLAENELSRLGSWG